MSLALDLAQKFVDLVMGIPSYGPPTPEQLANVRLVAHRGGSDGGHPENTMGAFEHAASVGMWGIELDVRWTRDGVPVIHHDAELGRVHPGSEAISSLSFEELRAKVPAIPTLAEVVERFGKRVHLMIEVKDSELEDASDKRAKLMEVLAPLGQLGDYHFLALSPGPFQCLDLPKAACILVAELNAPSLFREVKARGLGGLAGHYLLTTSSMQAELQAAGRKVGVGFLTNKKLLTREIVMGRDFIFTDLPGHMAQTLAELRGAS